MVTRAEHLVEIHPSIEKSPGNIAHQRTQKSIGRQLMRARLAFGRPLDGHEIGIAAECERAEMERPVTGHAVRLGCDYVLYGIHGISPSAVAGMWVYWWQISAHFWTEFSPRMVCSSSTPRFLARN